MSKNYLKKIFTLILLTSSIVSSAQQTLFNNGAAAGGLGIGGLVTNPTGGSGGAPISQLHSGMSTLGFGAQISANNSVADDFTVPLGQTWNVTSFEFFAYQTGSTTTSTINNVQIRIWNGTPGAGGTIVFGDLTTNRLSSTSFTGVYRVSSTTPTDTQRPIMRVIANFTTPIALSAGTYWVEYRFGGTLTSGPWAPPITIAGQTTTGNARQNSGGTWSNIIDVGPQGLPFIVGGFVGSGISVRGLGNNIPHDKYTTLSIDGTFLGVSNGTNTLSATFNIRNIGSEPLNISSIATTSSAFSIAGGAPTVISVGGDANFTVNYTPNGGSALDTIIITSNAGNYPTFRFGVAAVGGVVASLDNPLAEGALVISPNPSIGNFNVKIGGAKYTSAYATVYDISGKIVKTQENAQFTGSMDIDLTSFEKGVYILILETGGEKVARRIIKQ
jgi:hypothetical protein